METQTRGVSVFASVRIKSVRIKAGCKGKTTCEQGLITISCRADCSTQPVSCAISSLGHLQELVIVIALGVPNHSRDALLSGPC